MIPKFHYISNPVALQERAKALIEQHGGVRKAARASQIDAAYLIRLRDGEKTEPSDKVLRRLGLKRHVIYSALE